MRRFLISILMVQVPMGLTAEEPAALVPRVREAVQPEIERHLAEFQSATFAELALANSVPAHFKVPIRQQAISDPWGALTKLERRGLNAATAARGGLDRLPELLRHLARFRDGRVNVVSAATPFQAMTTLEEHAAYITCVFDAAAELRENALAKISAADREFLFTWPARHVETFGPQLSLTEETRPLLEGDLRFAQLGSTVIEASAFITSVLTICRLTEPEFLNSLRAALERATPIKDNPPEGITGDLLLVRQTKHGLIIFGGRGVNRYSAKKPIAFLADLGGDDTYTGLIASSIDANHGFSVFVDYAGNDTYESAPLGLATGRLGCGILIDRAGDDTYKLAPGSGGCGFAGAGLLIDESGKDKYIGSRFTQGAASVGLGLLLDLAGDDEYSAHGYSLGIGGPAGIGVLIDVEGDDVYRCGKHYGSGYNSTDAPNAKPGDAHYQYDAFGLGIGLGRRTYPQTDESARFHLAGGVGVWIDMAGNDRSESSNFSQACAYFFGIGLKMDLAGNDHHGAARYGFAAGAHYGLGLFLDYAGNDTYTSEGPTYNGGCAWDRSVFLLADGSGSDVYDFSQSSGPGRADRGGWAVFADLAGDDVYRTSSIGGATDKGLSIFFDGGGKDEYPAGIANGATRTDGKGSLIIDR